MPEAQLVHDVGSAPSRRTAQQPAPPCLLCAASELRLSQAQREAAELGSTVAELRAAQQVSAGRMCCAQVTDVATHAAVTECCCAVRVALVMCLTANQHEGLR
jgi:hypothetical protein